MPSGDDLSPTSSFARFDGLNERVPLQLVTRTKRQQRKQDLLKDAAGRLSSEISGLSTKLQLELVTELCARGTSVNNKAGSRLVNAALEGRHNDLGALICAAPPHALGPLLASKDKDGWTALHHAVREGNFECIHTLLLAGADINCRDNDGETPLHHAAKLGRPGCISLLITARADVNAKDDNNWTPLAHALAEPMEMVYQSEVDAAAAVLRAAGAVHG